MSTAPLMPSRHPANQTRGTLLILTHCPQIRPRMLAQLPSSPRPSMQRQQVRLGIHHTHSLPPTAHPIPTTQKTGLRTLPRHRHRTHPALIRIPHPTPTTRPPRPSPPPARAHMRPTAHPPRTHPVPRPPPIAVAPAPPTPTQPAPPLPQTTHRITSTPPLLPIPHRRRPRRQPRHPIPTRIHPPTTSLPLPPLPRAIHLKIPGQCSLILGMYSPSSSDSVH